jgi:hypothetical protein
MRNARAGMGRSQAESIAVLRAREDEVARERDWLHEAINRVARTMSDHGTGDHGTGEGPDSSAAATDAFRLLQHQAMAVGQRRVELRLR